MGTLWATWDKGHRSSLEARPQPKLALSPIERSLIKCNQFLYRGLREEGRDTRHRILDVNKYTNIFRLDTFSNTHCWLTLQHVP